MDGTSTLAYSSSPLLTTKKSDLNGDTFRCRMVSGTAAPATAGVVVMTAVVGEVVGTGSVVALFDLCWFWSLETWQGLVKLTLVLKCVIT